MQLERCAYCGPRCREHCPVCESTFTIPVQYGYPTSETFQQADHGELILGGCMIRNGAPQSGCDDCRTPWKTVDPTVEAELAGQSLTGLQRRMHGRPVELDRIADVMETVLDSIQGPVLADHDTLERFLPSWAQNPGEGPHWYQHLPIDVACSPACRDLLLAEGDWTVVSVWEPEDRDWRRVAGRGPYKTGTSIVAAVTKEATDIRTIGIGEKAQSYGSGDSGLDYMLHLARDRSPKWFRIGQQVLLEAAERGQHRNRLAVDLIHHGRWGAMVIPVHAEKPDGIADPLVIDVPDLEQPETTAATLTSEIRARELVPPSPRRIRQLTNWAHHQINKQMTHPPTNGGAGFRCLHPAVSNGHCVRCGTVHTPNSVRDAATVRHYGAHQTLQVRAGLYTRKPVAGVTTPTEPDYLEAEYRRYPRPPRGTTSPKDSQQPQPSPNAQTSETTPPAPSEPPDFQQPDLSPPPASPQPVPAPTLQSGTQATTTEAQLSRPLEPADIVYGVSNGQYVFLTRPLAESLAESWSEIEAAETYAEFVEALPGHIEDRVIEEVRSQFEGLGLDQEDLEGYERVDSGEIPGEFPMAQIGSGFWSGHELYPPWPPLDHEQYGTDTMSALNRALPAPVLRDLTYDEAIYWASTGDGEYLRAEDPQRVADTLREHGSSCVEDQALIDRATGPGW